MIRLQQLFVFIIAACTILPVHAVVRINELVASNSGSLTDSFGDDPDWIELHNTDAAAVDLDGWRLVGGGTGWTLPAVSIPANGFLIVFASDRDLVTPGGELHAGYKLSSGGEVVELFNAVDVLVDSIDPAYPALLSDQAFGYDVDGLKNVLLAPTPNAANAPAAPPAVNFSIPPGGFSGSINVQLTTTPPGLPIYYTLDGTVPTSNSLVYAAALTLNKTTTLMASSSDGVNLSRPAQASYVAMDAAALAASSDLPLVILSAPAGFPVPDTLEEAAYSDAIISVIDVDTLGDLRARLSDPAAYAGPAAVRIQGTAADQAEHLKKSFRFELRASTASGADFRTDLLGLGKEADFVLKAPGRYDRSMIQNPLVQSLASELTPVDMDMRFVELYLDTNGDQILQATEYYGLMVLSETVKVGSRRIDIEDLNSSDVAEPEVGGGYVFSIDDVDEDRTIIGATPEADRWVHINRPNAANIVPQQLDWASRFLNQFDHALDGSDWFAACGPHEYVDLDSWIDVWLLQMLSANPEALISDTYFYKARSGPLFAGPLWNMEHSFDSAANCALLAPAGVDPMGWHYWGDLWDFPEVRARLQSRWQVLRTKNFSEADLHAQVDAFAASIAEAYLRDAAVWTVADPARYGSRYSGTLTGEINALKTWISCRLTTLDGLFAPAAAGPVLDNPGTYLFEPNIMVGIPLTASGNAPIVFSAEGLPRGLSLDPWTGWISGIMDPGTPRTSEVAVRATDATGASDTNLLTIIYNFGSGYWPDIAEEIVLWPRETRVWKYNNSGGDLGTVWRNPGYDDSTWPSGAARIGNASNGGAPMNTIIPAPSGFSMYFRSEFTITDLNDVVGMIAQCQYDDALMVWINGVEVYRTIRGNLPANGEVAYNYPVPFGGAEYQYIIVPGTNTTETGVTVFLPPIPTSLLNEGNNTMAVQLWNRNGSSDSNFDVAYSLMVIGDNNTPPGGQGAATNAPPSPANYAPDYPFCDDPNLPAIRINEIMYKPVDNLPSVFDTKEWVELYNADSSPVDLSGWTLLQGTNTWTFPVGSQIAAGGFAVGAGDLSAFSEAHPAASGFSLSGLELSNRGGQLQLIDADGRSIDLLVYADRAPWPSEPDAPGPSLSRSTPGLDALDPANWFESGNIGGTPGAVNTPVSCNPPGLVINEINYHSAGGGADAGDWVELHNPTATAIALANWSLAEDSHLYALPAATIPAGGYVVLVQSPGLFSTAFPGVPFLGPTGFGLSNSGDNLSLLSPERCLADLVPYADALPWDFQADGSGQTLSLYTPAFENQDPWSWAAATPTPGQSNAHPAPCSPPPGGLVITEMNVDSSPFIDLGDWIEIHNPSAAAVNLSDWHVFHGDGRFDFPNFTFLGPGGYLVVAEQYFPFVAQFPGVQTINGFGFTLSGGGERVVLSSSTGCVVDDVSYDNSSPWPALLGIGGTLSLDGAGLDNNAGGNWSLGDGLGTPGAANNTPACPVASPRILINELSIAGPAGDWLELHNPGTAPIDISGFALNDEKSFSWIPSNTSIAAGGYLVFSEDPIAFQTVHPGVAIAGSLGFGLSATNEVIRLTSLEHCLVDEVPYDTLGAWPGGQIFGLLAPNLDNALGQSWITQPDAAGTPGALNSVRCGPGVVDDLVLWLRPDDGVLIDANNRVENWTAQNGATQVDQAVAAAKPLWVADGLGASPSLRFDGGDYLGGAFDSDLLTGNGVGDFTWFSVSRASDLAGTDAVMSFEANLYFAWSAGRSLVAANANHVATTEDLTTQQPVIHSARVAPSLGLVSMWNDSQPLSLANATPSGNVGARSHVAVGSRVATQATWGFIGDIGDIIAFKRGLSNSEIRDVQSFLSLRFGHPLDLSAQPLTLNGSTLYQQAGYNEEVLGLAINRLHCLNLTDATSGELRVHSPAHLEHGEYLIFGHNAGGLLPLNPDVPAGTLRRMDRVWQARAFGDAGTVSLSFDLSGVLQTGASAADYSLLLDTDANFANAQTLPASSFVNGIVTFNNIALNDGQFLSLAAPPVLAPGAVPNGLSLWLRGDLGATVGAGGQLTDWVDQSAGLRDATLFGSPAIASADTLNGHATVRFDGSEYLQWDSFAESFNGGDLYIVWEHDAVAGAFGTYRFGHPSYGTGSNTGPGGSLQNGFGHQGFNQVVHTDGLNFPQLHNTAIAPGAWVQRRDGVDELAVAETVDFGTPVHWLGRSSSSYLQGRVAEVILYDRALPSSERHAVETYLSIKYGLTIPVAQHLNYSHTSHPAHLVGLGRDSTYQPLDQTASRSVEDDAILTLLDEAPRADGDYLVIGSDAASANPGAFSAPAGIDQRLQRSWRVEHTGTPRPVTLRFDLTGLGVDLSDPDDFHLLVDTDDGDFSNAQLPLSTRSVLGNIVRFEGVLLPHNAWFALGTEVGPIPVALTAPSPVNATEHLPVSFTVSPANLSYSFDGPAPPGATLSPAGVFQWTPGESTGGLSFSIPIYGVRTQGLFTYEGRMTVVVNVAEVNVAPSITSAANATLDEGQPWTQTLQGTDPDLPAPTLTWSLVGAPPGLSLSGSTLAWTPTEAQGPGTYTFDVVLSDGQLTDSRSLTLVVDEVDTAPIIPNINAPSIPEEVAWSFAVPVIDPDIPETLSWSVTGPTGLSIDTGGTLHWTPTEAQGPASYQILVEVTDAKGASDTAAFVIHVLEVNVAPEFSSASFSASIAERDVWSHQVAASDVDSATLTFSLGANSPPGLVIDSTSGWLRWLPGDSVGSATVSFDVVVTDPGGLSDSMSISLNVADRPGPPAVFTCTENLVLVSAGATWSWSKIPVGHTWKEPWADLSGWGSGVGSIGYGESDLVTTIPAGQVRTVFRHTFSLSDANAVNGLILHLQRDDGAIVYLNGEEIIRDNLPAVGLINETSTASSSVFGAAERAWYSFVVPPARLAEGDNILAVAVHQVAANSSDMRFNARLEASRLTACAPMINAQALFLQDQLQWNSIPGTTYMIETNTDLLTASWQSFQHITATQTTTEVPVSYPNRRTFYRIRVEP